MALGIFYCRVLGGPYGGPRLFLMSEVPLYMYSRVTPVVLMRQTPLLAGPGRARLGGKELQTVLTFTLYVENKSRITSRPPTRDPGTRPGTGSA